MSVVDTDVIKQLNINTKELQELEEAFFAAVLPTVKYSPRPISLTNTYEEISIKEFLEKVGMQRWTNSVLVPAKIRDKIWTDKTFDKNSYPTLLSRLIAPLTSLVICDINKQVGKGLFLAHDAKAPILKGTIIALYAGVVVEAGKGSDEYSMSLRCEEHRPSIIANSYHFPQMNCGSAGNETHFIQDAPTIDELNSVKNLSKLEASNIVTSNLIVQPTVHFGCPLSFFVAGRDIHPGEQLVFSYDEGKGNYWEGKERCVSNKDGLIIGKFISKTHIQLESSYKASESLATPYIKSGTNVNVIYPDDAIDAEIFVIKNVNLTLEIWKKRFASTTLEHECISAMYNAFNDSQFNNKNNTGSDRLKKMLMVSSKEQYTKVYKSTLAILNAEIFFFMKSHQMLNNINPKKEELSEGLEAMMAKIIALKNNTTSKTTGINELKGKDISAGTQTLSAFKTHKNQGSPATNTASSSATVTNDSSNSKEKSVRSKKVDSSFASK